MQSTKLYKKYLFFKHLTVYKLSEYWQTLPFVFRINAISSEIFFYCGRVRLLDTDTRIVARNVSTFIFINTAFSAAKTVKTRTGVVEFIIHAYSIVAWYWSVIPRDVTPVNVNLTRFSFVTAGAIAFVIVHLKSKARSHWSVCLRPCLHGIGSAWSRHSVRLVCGHICSQHFS